MKVVGAAFRRWFAASASPTSRFFSPTSASGRAWSPASPSSISRPGARAWRWCRHRGRGDAGDPGDRTGGGAALRLALTHLTDQLGQAVFLLSLVVVRNWPPWPRHRAVKDRSSTRP